MGIKSLGSLRHLIYIKAHFGTMPELITKLVIRRLGLSELLIY